MKTSSLAAAAILLALASASLAAGELLDVSVHCSSCKAYIAPPSEIELFWKNPESGLPYRSLAKVQERLAAEGRPVFAIMNGGIFEPDGSPTGLHIENGAVVNPLNEKQGRGNFYFMPNGVFLIDEKGKASIMETGDFKRSGITPRLALQSGPILLLNGKINPKFTAGSSSRKHRNGIGVDSKGNVVFAITLTRAQGQVLQPNLYEFAELFQKLGCESALFLDGELSAMVVDPQGPIANPGSFGAIIVAVGKPQPEKKD